MKMNSKFKTLLSHSSDWKQLIHDIKDKVFKVSDEYKELFADPGHINIHHPSHSKSKASGSKPVASGSSSTTILFYQTLPPLPSASKTPTQPPPPPASKTPTPPPPPSISKDHVPPNISSSTIPPASVTNPALDLSTREGKKENIENFNLIFDEIGNILEP